MAAQVVTASGSVGTSTTYIATAGSPANTTSAKATIITGSTTARNLSVTTQDPVGGGSVTVTMRKNGAASALTVTINGGNAIGLDNTHTVSLVAGDVIDFTSLSAGGAVSTQVFISFELD